jgi:hypothetical protein
MLSFPTVVSLLYIDMDSVTEIVSKFMQMAIPEEPNEAERTNGSEDLEEILNNLKNLKNILFWVGLEEDHTYAWFEINYK